MSIYDMGENIDRYIEDIYLIEDYIDRFLPSVHESKDFYYPFNNMLFGYISQ